MTTMIVVHCDNCGARLEKYPSRVRAHNFCNQACCIEWRNNTGFYRKEQHPQWNGGPVERTCKHCGKTFLVKRSRAKRGSGTYCSVECAHNDRTVLKHCEVCGAEIRLKKSRDKNGQGKYCSIECRSIGYIEQGTFSGENNPNYKDGKCYSREYVCMHSARRRTRMATNGGDYTLQEWEELCTDYGNRCLACGRDDVKLTVDHIVPVIKGGSNDISNLQPLCKSCNSIKNARAIDYR